MEIVKYPNPILKQVCQPVVLFNREHRNFLVELSELLEHDQEYAGVAAPQVGVSKRIVAIKYFGKVVVMVNPVITRFYAEKETEKEGCLSFPDLWLNIERPRTIDIRYWDKYDKYQFVTLSGFLARCVQHEADHLDGMLFIDRIKPDDMESQALLQQWLGAKNENQKA